MCLFDYLCSPIQSFASIFGLSALNMSSGHTWEAAGTDRVGQNVVGHRGLMVTWSALSRDPYAGNRWKILQAWIVEGVGRVVWKLRGDLEKSTKSGEAYLIRRASRFSRQLWMDNSPLSDTCWEKIDGPLRKRAFLTEKTTSCQTWGLPSNNLSEGMISLKHPAKF